MLRCIAVVRKGAVGGKEPLGGATNGSGIGGALGATAASDGVKQAEGGRGRRWAGGGRWAGGEEEEEDSPSEASSVVPDRAAPPAMLNGAHLAVSLESGANAKAAAKGEGGARRATQVPAEGERSTPGELAALAATPAATQL